MSARENILAKLKKADALPMEEPPVFDYYREMGVSWANDVERLKHWAAAMRAVKTEIYWVTKTNWPCSVSNGSRMFFKPLPSAAWRNTCGHWKQNTASWLVQLWPIPISNRAVLSEKSTTGKTNFLPILRPDLVALNAVLPVLARLCWSPVLWSRVV